MASLKEIRGRIASVRSTLKITSAMRLIASAHLHSAQNALGSAIVYRDALEGMFRRLLSDNPAAGAALEQALRNSAACDAPDASSDRTAVVLVTSNQTLCGSFNANILREFDAAGFGKGNCTVYAVGKVGLKHLRRDGWDAVDCCSLAGKPSREAAEQLALSLVRDFASGIFSHVEIVRAHYENPFSQPLRREIFLPLTAPAASDDASLPQEYIVEPSPAFVVEAMLPKVLLQGFYVALLDSAAAEHAARSTAMQMASENGTALLGELTLTCNKLRQQEITSQILDISNGQSAE